MRRSQNPRVPSAIVASILSSAAMAGGGRGGVIYVDAAAPPGGNGASWAAAYSDLQDALAAADAGDQVWVAAGTYTPTGPNGNRDVSFWMESGVALYGGFAGYEEFVWERDWEVNVTILSGDLNGDDGPYFINYGENSMHVVRSNGDADTAELDGFLVTGGYAEVGGSPTGTGGGLYITGGEPTIVHCAFIASWAQYGGGVYCRDASPHIIDCVFADNGAAADAGGLRLFGSSAVVTGCDFYNNVAEAGGGISCVEPSTVTIEDCLLEGNTGNAFAGGIRIANDTIGLVRRCTLIGNEGSVVGGGMLVTATEPAEVRNCLFARNVTQSFGGAVFDECDSTYVNCGFSHNIAGGVGPDLGGACAIVGFSDMINCSFSANEGAAIYSDFFPPTFHNCIFWDNVPTQIYDDGPPSTLHYCDIQGGWSGPGSNIMDEDPLFVQPGSDDLRLSYGSPCVNAGDNSAIPPGVLYDMLGADRIIDGIVDLGACEGEYDPLPPQAGESNLNPGEIVFLVPEGWGYDPLYYPIIIFTNTAGGGGVEVLVTQFADDMHPGAEGYTEVSAVLRLETTAANGQFQANVLIPFTADDLGGADPLSADLTYFDEGVGNWAIAAAANTVPSPGHPGPIGERIVTIAGGAPDLPTDIGDYGVHWDPALGRGYVWAILDHAADFGVGWPLCPADCDQPPNGVVNILDVNAVLTAWGEAEGPFDVNNDGTVNVLDILDVLAAWGMCP